MRTHELAAFGAVEGLPCSVMIATSTAPVAAAVFVHGFRGDSERSWREFTGLVNGDANWAGWDLYFVQYDSVRENIGFTASRLTDLVNLVVPHPPDELITGTDPRNGQTVRVRDSAGSYERLVLVGHSQGGVVIRKAIAEQAMEIARAAKSNNGVSEPDALCNATVRLFAPALFGIQFSSWKGAARELDSVWALIKVVLGKSPSYKELQSDSRLLRSLQGDTERMARELGSAAPALQAAILWAEHDDLVASGLRYACDPPYRYAIRKTHSSVCKPHSDYVLPLNFVR